MNRPLDQWIAEEGWKDFERDIRSHLKIMMECEEKDIDSAARLIMISLRNRIQRKKCKI